MSDRQFASACYTDRHWLNNTMARRQAFLFIMLSEGLKGSRNDRSISSCHSISALISLSLYLGCFRFGWIAKAVLCPPWPWNIVSCVILKRVEHSGSVFPIFFYIAVANQCLDYTIRYCYINYQHKLFPPAKVGHALTSVALIQLLVSHAVLNKHRGCWAAYIDKIWGFFLLSFLSLIYSLFPICSLQYFNFLKLLFFL